jgi:hypothetical protein
MAKTKSGAFWVTWASENAKNSSSVDDLAEPFRSNARAFIGALEDAGAQVDVTATLRSPRRAYLFHWCWRIGLGKVAASAALPMDGVDIEWDHGDEAQSRRGAREMIEGFGLAVPPSSVNPPALRSNHIAGLAIDMDITWTGTIVVQRPDGSPRPVPFVDDVNKNITLHAVGSAYGVRKLTTDAPHWSHDGH